jgi:hypothetical protein
MVCVQFLTTKETAEKKTAMKVLLALCWPLALEFGHFAA